MHFFQWKIEISPKLDFDLRGLKYVQMDYFWLWSGRDNSIMLREKNGFLDFRPTLVFEFSLIMMAMKPQGHGVKSVGVNLPDSFLGLPSNSVNYPQRTTIYNEICLK